MLLLLLLLQFLLCFILFKKRFIKIFYSILHVQRLHSMTELYGRADKDKIRQLVYQAKALSVPTAP